MRINPIIGNFNSLVFFKVNDFILLFFLSIYYLMDSQRSSKVFLLDWQCPITWANQDLCVVLLQFQVLSRIYISLSHLGSVFLCSVNITKNPELPIAKAIKFYINWLYPKESFFGDLEFELKSVNDLRNYNKLM